MLCWLHRAPRRLSNLICRRFPQFIIIFHYSNDHNLRVRSRSLRHPTCIYKRTIWPVNRVELDKALPTNSLSHYNIASVFSCIGFFSIRRTTLTPCISCPPAAAQMVAGKWPNSRRQRSGCHDLAAKPERSSKLTFQQKISIWK